MARRNKTSGARDTVQIKGFARLALQNAETGALEFDSGWVPNALTDVGYANYVCGVIGALANSSRPAYIALATQTAAATTTQDDPSGPFGGRVASSRWTPKPWARPAWTCVWTGWTPLPPSG